MREEPTFLPFPFLPAHDPAKEMQNHPFQAARINNQLIETNDTRLCLVMAQQTSTLLSPSSTLHVMLECCNSAPGGNSHPHEISASSVFQGLPPCRISECCKMSLPCPICLPASQMECGVPQDVIPRQFGQRSISPKRG